MSLGQRARVALKEIILVLLFFAAVILVVAAEEVGIVIAFMAFIVFLAKGERIKAKKRSEKEAKEDLKEATASKRDSRFREQEELRKDIEAKRPQIIDAIKRLYLDRPADERQRLATVGIEFLTDSNIANLSPEEAAKTAQKRLQKDGQE